MTEALHITTSSDVAALAARIASSTAVALDTEFLWEKTYRPQLCLLQVRSPESRPPSIPSAVPT